jgi:hypothetical protein
MRGRDMWHECGTTEMYLKVLVEKPEQIIQLGTSQV